MLPSFHRLSLQTHSRVTSGLFDSLLGKREAPEEEEAPAVLDGERDIKLLILDFDLTMTTTVVERGNRPPFKNVTSDKLELFKGLTKEQHIANFGGPARVAAMAQLFEELTKVGVELRILSYGKSEAIIIALEAAGLADYFTTLNQPLGNLVFGTDVPPLNDDRTYKAIVVQEWLEEEDLQWDEVAFLDDDLGNIATPVDLGGEDQGVAQLLYPGHARLHPVGYFALSEPWIRDMCGLNQLGEAGQGSSA